MKKPKIKIKSRVAKCKDCNSLNLIRKTWLSWERIEREMFCGKCGSKNMKFIESKKELEKELRK